MYISNSSSNSGGIRQLTGAVTAGPGTGSQVATVTGLTLGASGKVYIDGSNLFTGTVSSFPALGGINVVLTSDGSLDAGSIGAGNFIVGAGLTVGTAITNNFVFGTNHTISNNSNSAIIIGQGITGQDRSIAIGGGDVTESGSCTASHQLVMGSNICYLDHAYIGYGVRNVTDGVLGSFTLHATDVSGAHSLTNKSAASGVFRIAGAKGTGTGTGGPVQIAIAPAGLTGSSQNSEILAFEVNGEGVIGTPLLDAYSTPYIDSAKKLRSAANGTSGKVWTSNGVSSNPSWETFSLAIGTTINSSTDTSVLYIDSGDLTQDPTHFTYDSTNKSFAVGTSANSSISIYGRREAVDVAGYALEGDMLSSITGNTAAINGGIQGYGSKSVDVGITDGGSITGVLAYAERYPVLVVTDDGALDGVYGMQSEVHQDSSSALAVTNKLAGLRIITSATTGSVTDAYDIIIESGTLGATITNRWGLVILADNSGTKVNYLTGNTQFGGTAPGSQKTTIASTGNISTDGDISLSTLGKSLNIKEGSNAKAGVATLVAGTKTISTTAFNSTTSRIIVSRQAAGGTLGHLSIANPVNATSFDVLSSNNADTSVVYWIIVDAI